jgi:hypothetical protein
VARGRPDGAYAGWPSDKIDHSAPRIRLQFLGLGVPSAEYVWVCQETTVVEIAAAKSAGRDGNLVASFPLKTLSGCYGYDRAE